MRINTGARITANFVTLIEGFQQFDNDLNKLQHFVEVNETAISKILKKWDKTSKSRTKELYLQRAVEAQPCFNRDILRDLSDRATTARLELEALSEGENIQHLEPNKPTIGQRVGTEESDVDLQVLQAASAGNLPALREWLNRLSTSPNAGESLTRIFLASISEAPNESLRLLLESKFVDIQAEDDINERNCLHEATIYGKESVLDYALTHGVDPTRLDAYGRAPTHYACLKGRISMLEKLIATAPQTINLKDHDNFTPLIHSIVRERLDCVRLLLAHEAHIEPTSESDHIPLNLACQHGSVEVVQMLLERKARFLPDAEGLFPQHLVARSSMTADLLLMLQRFDADLNQRDKLYQWTPLFHAASEGRVECLRALLEYGANADALDEKNLTATYYATWEGHLQCVDLLLERQLQKASQKANGMMLAPQSTLPITDIELNDVDLPSEADGIPDLSLPPPIIPMRRYGHNFLDTKCFVAINFDRNAKAIQFFNEARYPAARITISSKTSDLIPRNIILPIQEDSRSVLFQVDNLSNFQIDFEIFPTFGSKVIAKSVALPEIFRTIDSSSGTCCLPLFDPRLRAVGQIFFNFQVIKPYSGRPLEITQYPTYWKATSALDDNPTLITGSSLSGDYLRLCVHLTKDAVPVIYPTSSLTHAGLEVSIADLPFSRLATLSSKLTAPRSASDRASILEWRDKFATSVLSLSDVLKALPAAINLNLHIIYPVELHPGSDANTGMDINTFADALLTNVFDHARALREESTELNRSIVFTSRNSHICTALNWKQPNFPVLLCNDLGSTSGAKPASENTCSIKESVRLAQSNNFMGIACSGRILEMVPSLTETIKQAGLVLVSDNSDSAQTDQLASKLGFAPMPEGVNGLIKANGILRFNESVDM